MTIQADDRSPVDLNAPRLGQLVKIIHNKTGAEEWWLYTPMRRWVKINRDAEIPAEPIALPSTDNGYV